MVRRLRGDPQLRIAKRAFEAAVAQYEEARHHYEHLDERLPQIAETGQAAVGALSWWTARTDKEFSTTFVMPGTMAVGEKQMFTRVPAAMRSTVDHFWIVIAGAEYYLTGAHDAVVSLEQRLREWSTSLA